MADLHPKRPLLPFRDREEAGDLLAEQLLGYRDQPKSWVVGLPRGGVRTAGRVALALRLPLDVVCPRKIGAPFQPEYAIGAVAEEGEGFFDPALLARLGVTLESLGGAINAERQEAHRRLLLYRRHLPPRSWKGATLLLVDDGIATGSTMKAAISSARALGAAQVVVAVPVLPADRVEEFRHLADQLVYLAAPRDFYAVGQFYDEFEATSDQEVLQILEAQLEKLPC